MPTITDWLMVGITAVYVIATIAICWANIKSADATREQVAEAKRQFEEINRALVTVSFEIIKTGLAVLHIHNCGKRIAKNVKIEVSEDFLTNMADEQDRNGVERLCKSSFVLGIDQSWNICIGSHLQLEQMSKEKLSIHITYEDSMAAYDENTEIDLKQYFWALMYESPTEDLYQEVKKLTKSLHSIEKSIQKQTRLSEGGKDNA